MVIVGDDVTRLVVARLNDKIYEIDPKGTMPEVFVVSLVLLVSQNPKGISGKKPSIRVVLIGGPFRGPHFYPRKKKFERSFLYLRGCGEMARGIVQGDNSRGKISHTA